MKTFFCLKAVDTRRLQNQTTDTHTVVKFPAAGRCEGAFGSSLHCHVVVCQDGSLFMIDLDLDFDYDFGE